MGSKRVPKPIIIKLNPKKVITISSWYVGPGGKKYGEKTYKETVDGKRIK